MLRINLEAFLASGLELEVLCPYAIYGDSCADRQVLLSALKEGILEIDDSDQNRLWKPGHACSAAKQREIKHVANELRDMRGDTEDELLEHLEYFSTWKRAMWSRKPGRDALEPIRARYFLDDHAEFATAIDSGEWTLEDNELAKTWLNEVRRAALEEDE